MSLARKGESSVAIYVGLARRVLSLLLLLISTFMGPSASGGSIGSRQFVSKPGPVLASPLLSVCAIANALSYTQEDASTRDKRPGKQPKKQEAAPAPPHAKQLKKSQPVSTRPASNGLRKINLNVQVRYWDESQIQEPDMPTVTIWSREQDKSSVSSLKIKDLKKNGRGLFSFTLSNGMNDRKLYWVTVDAANGKFNGEAPVRQPEEEEDSLTIPVELYPTISFEITVRAANNAPLARLPLFVVEKNQSDPLSSIPRETGPDGKAKFSKGINPDSQYVIFAGADEPFEIEKDEIKDRKLKKELSLGEQIPKTLIKVGTASGPVARAEVTIKLNDLSMSTEFTDKNGEANFRVNSHEVKAITVTAGKYEEFSCEAGEGECSEVTEKGVVTINLNPASTSPSLLMWIVDLFKSATGMMFIALAVLFIVFGVVTLSKLGATNRPKISNHHLARGASKPPEPTSITTKEASSEASELTSLPEEPNPFTQTTLEPETESTSTASPSVSSSSPSESLSLPGSLSIELAKEAYKRCARKEKLLLEPVKLDLMLGDSADNESFQFRETKDPGSKFILFKDDENKGWLFPNPAPSVFQTEVEQTWGLIFKDLRKEEFGRKKERLNPIEATRITNASGKSIWVAEPKPYHFA
jgi:hypothetical protein